MLINSHFVNYIFFCQNVFDGVGMATVGLYCVYKMVFMRMTHSGICRINIKLEYLLLKI